MIEFDDHRVQFLENRIITELSPTLKSDTKSDFNLNNIITLLEELKNNELISEVTE